MLFRRIITVALLVGVVAGLLYSALQISTVNPIIFQAETFEIPAAHDHGADAIAGHSHEADEWAPEDGTERNLYTLFANVAAAIGFCAILLALMAQLQLQGVARITPLKGLLWGFGGYVTFFVAPTIGMPPEIPGMEAPAIESRQWWWAAVVLGVGVGLLLLAFAPGKWKLLGVVSALVPYALQIPHLGGTMVFSHPDPATVNALIQLHQKFVMYTSLSNLAFWLVMGGLCAYALRRWIVSGSHDADLA